jgi:hypothetical protein
MKTSACFTAEIERLSCMQFRERERESKVLAAHACIMEWTYYYVFACHGPVKPVCFYI